ncbi:hypothetical protein PHOSAC3_140086 [Mesotoga infera]|nr:hypothetical protein PHOSAC3_140086 [Mesotoga infera]
MCGADYLLSSSLVFLYCTAIWHAASNTSTPTWTMSMIACAVFVGLRDGLSSFGFTVSPPFPSVSSHVHDIYHTF